MLRRLKSKLKNTVFGHMYKTLRSGLRECVSIMRTARYKRERHGVIESYLEKHSIRKLQIGCGRTHLKGWLNSDVLSKDMNLRGEIYLDATEPFPIGDNTFDYD